MAFSGAGAQIDSADRIDVETSHHIQITKVSLSLLVSHYQESTGLLE